MKMLPALKHAQIGYGIRRLAWGADDLLYWNHDSNELCFVSEAKGQSIDKDTFQISEPWKAGDAWNPNDEAVIAAWKAEDWTVI